MNLFFQGPSSLENLERIAEQELLYEKYLSGSNQGGETTDGSQFLCSSINSTPPMPMLPRYVE